LYYFSNDKKKLKQVICQISFGDVGNSGIGNYHGKAGFDTFSHHKNMMKRSTWIDLPLKYPPYSATKMNLGKKML
jgi:aldehyde dehydrogenase (NAD+)